MAKFKVRDIQNEEMYGRMCEVKYIHTYTLDQLIDWLHDLEEIDFDIIWCKQHRVIMQHKRNRSDIVLIDVKATINPKDNRIMRYFQPMILMF